MNNLVLSRKILFSIFCLTAVLSTNQAYACSPSPDYWMYIKIHLDVEPTGAGSVYASTDQASAQNVNNCIAAPHEWSSSTHESNINSTVWYVNTTNNDVERYVFVGWRDDTNGGNIVSTSQNPETGFHDSGQYAAKEADGSGGKTADKPYYPPVPFNATLNMTAVYREMARAVIVKPNDATAGAAQVTKIASATSGANELEISVGDEVEINAWPLGYESKFVGWYKDGVMITRENPYRFVINEDNQGTYVAHFSTGHKFTRIKSKQNQRYINAINDQGNIDDFSSLQLISSGETYSAGTVFQISDWKVTGGHPYAYEVQGFSSSSLYQDGGVYVTMLQNTPENTWRIFANRSFFYMGDTGGSSVEVTYDNAAENNKWYFELMDKDLETKENYFSLDPEKLVQVGDKYYTTLRTSWNILFNPGQMTPYVVTSVDETNGTFEMAPLTGNIIPAGTPVIIETKSSDIEENRMVPTKTAAASGAVPAGNKLVTSTKYFPNQTVAPSDNYKKLMVNAAGRLAFGGNALSTVNGNEAYLCVNKEVTLPVSYTSVTLAELVETGVVGEKYNVTDLTAVQWVDGNQMLIAKDNNGYANPDAMPEGETWVDYMSQSKESIKNDLNGREGITATVPETYDQSNWIALHLAQGKSATTAQLDYAGKRLTGVKGTLLNVTNPELLLEAELGTSTETPANVVPNVYVAASFNGDNHQPGTNDKEYFFVQPKPMELATIGWAQWNADNEQFVVPENVAHPEWNTAGLSGEFGLNGSLMEQGFDMSKLLDGHSYLMPALIKRNAEDYESIYILGNVDGNQFVPNKGVEMYTMDGKTYTATATITESDQGYGFFSFTKKLASQSGQNGWDEINTGNYRFGAKSDGDFLFTDEYLGQTLDLTTRNKEAESFKMPTGTYLLTVAGTNVAQLEGMTLVVSRIDGSSRAPRRADGTQKNSYIAYPLRLVQTTSVGESGVITGVTAIGGSRTVAAVDYYNLAGQRSTRPWQGVNIVVTRYTDGTSSTNKQIKN